MRAHRDDRVVIKRDERRALLRGKAEAVGVSSSVGEIVGATVRVMREPVERVNESD